MRYKNENMGCRSEDMKNAIKMFIIKLFFMIRFYSPVFNNLDL